MHIVYIFHISYKKDVFEKVKSLGERLVSEVLAAVALLITVKITLQNVFPFLLDPAC